MARQFFMLAPSAPTGWSGPFDLDYVMAKASDRMRIGEGPFSRYKNHKKVGFRRRKRFALIAIRYDIDHGGPGDVFSIRKREDSTNSRPGTGGEVLRIREGKPSVDVININGNHKADVCWTAVVKQFTEIPIYFLGSYVCKYVSGSWTRSQHSYGNAVDFGSDSMDQLHLIANWLVAHATELDIEHVIVADTVWTRGYGWSHYDGEYHYHCHADFTPEQYGSCGVKG